MTMGPSVDGKRSFQVWAPYATRGVELDVNGQRHEMSAGPDGWWWVAAPADEGDRYGFRIDGGPVLPDPRAHSLPEGPDGPGQVVDSVRPTRLALETDGDTDPDPAVAADQVADDEVAAAAVDDPSKPAAPKGISLKGAACYELSVGTFTVEGTFDGVADRLDHLADLGIDVILLGPVALAGDLDPRGYDVRAPLAVDLRYGGPRRLAALVQACHDRGIGIGVDFVVGCRDGRGSPLNNFAPYYQVAPDTVSGWAPNLDGPDSDGVRAYFIAAAVHWLTEFDLDALRLHDAGSLVDRRALTFTEELAHVMSELSDQTGRPRWLIVDDDRLDPRTVTPVPEGGLGGDAVFSDDVGRGLWQAATGPVERVADTLAHVLGDPFWPAGGFSSRHGRTNGRSLDPAAVPGWRFLTQLTAPGAQPPDLASIGVRRWCCIVAVLLTGATTPVLTMGEEWGFTGSALAAPEIGAPRVGEPGVGEPHAGEPLDWAMSTQGDGPRIMAWYRALLALRSARPELRDPSLTDLEVRPGAQPGVVVIYRGGHRIAVNLGAASATVDLGLETSHRRVVLLSLDPTTAVAYEGTVQLPPDGVAVVGPSLNPGGGK